MPSVIDEHTQFTDSAGLPIVNGSIYIGSRDQDPVTNPITIYSDRDLLTAIANPQLTDANGRTVNKIWVPGSYSIRVNNSVGVQHYLELDAGGGSPSVDDIAGLLAASQASGIVQTLGFHARGDSGGDLYYWDAAQDRANHNGINILDPTRILPTTWSDTAEVDAWFTASTGTGCWVSTVRERIDLAKCGLIKDDDSVGYANYKIIRAAHVYAITHNNFTPPAYHPSDPLQGNITIHIPRGIFYILGASPFALTKTELNAFSLGSFRRGLSWAGEGRQQSIFVLQSTGDSQGTWFYDNRDAAEGITSLYDNVQFRDLTLRSTDWSLASVANTRRYRVTSALTINGFYMESYGWEKMFNFDNVIFEGFDEAFVFRGSGNVDQHTWSTCQFDGIIDKVFDIGNDQSVCNRMFGVDIMTYGDVFLVGETGGGDFIWIGGSLHQDSAYDGSNLTDSATGLGNRRALIHYNTEDVSSGAAPNFGNCNFVFDHLRVENYDEYNHLVWAERDNTTAYGTGIARFRDCAFTIDFQWADGLNYDTGAPSVRSTSRELVKVNRMSVDIHFDRCVFARYQYFDFADIGSVASPNANATVRISNSALDWDTPTNGMLATRIQKTVDTGDRCNVNFVSENNYATFTDVVDAMSCEDFSMTSAIGGFNTDNLKYAHVKLDNVVWPDAAGSVNRLYLHPGAIVTSVFINKSAADSGTGSASYRVELVDSAAGGIYATSNFQEEDAYVERTDVTTPFVVPAAPNNYVKMNGANGGGGNVVQNDSGMFLVGYYSNL